MCIKFHSRHCIFFQVECVSKTFNIPFNSQRSRIIFGRMKTEKKKPKQPRNKQHNCRRLRTYEMKNIFLKTKEKKKLVRMHIHTHSFINSFRWLHFQLRQQHFISPECHKRTKKKHTPNINLLFDSLFFFFFI